MGEVPPEFRCWCRRWLRPCHAKITQEDMFCDTCREGCSLIASGADAVLQWWMHVKVVKLTRGAATVS